MNVLSLETLSNNWAAFTVFGVLGIVDVVWVVVVVLAMLRSNEKVALCKPEP